MHPDTTDLGHDVFVMDTLLGGYDAITSSYLIRGSRPCLVETGTSHSARPWGGPSGICAPPMPSGLQPSVTRVRSTWEAAAALRHSTIPAMLPTTSVGGFPDRRPLHG